MALSKIKGTVIADNAINADRIADGTVVASDLLDNTLTGAKLATDIAITTSGNITTTGAFTSTGIDDNATSTAITINSSEQVSFTAGTVSSPSITTSGDTNTGIFFPASDTMAFTEGGVERMRIDDNGDISFLDSTGATTRFFWDTSLRSIGINTTAPETALHVALSNTNYGGVNTGTEPGHALTISSAGNGGAGRGTSMVFQSPGSSSSVTTAKIDALQNSQSSTANNANLVFNVANTSGNLTRRLLIGNGGDISFYEDTGTTAKLFWDASAERLGIGATSPEGKLHIKEDNVGIPSTDADDLVIEKTVDTGLSILSTTTGRIFFGDASDNSVGRITYVHIDDSMRFNNNASESMRIDSSGNVGIGTSSPSTNLEVSGSSGLASGSGTTNALRIADVGSGSSWSTTQDFSQLQFSSTDLTNPGGSGVRFSIGVVSANAAHTYSDLTFRNYDGTEHMRINGAFGNVGIGTSSPERTLDVSGDMRISDTGVNTGLRITVDTNREAYLVFGDTSDASMAGIAYDNSTNALTFDANNSERMRIDSSGNVGIGTSSPAAMLDISNSADVTQLRLSRTVSGTAIMKINASGYLNIKNTSGAGIRFGTNNVENRMTIDTSGNVGIGTSSPDTKLQIKGSANSSQLILGGTDNRGLKISTTNEGGQNDGSVIFDAQDTEAGGLNSNLIFSTGGSERVRIGGDGKTKIDGGTFAVDATNNRVGVGTSFPTHKFTVYNLSGTAMTTTIGSSGSGLFVNSQGISNTMTALSFNTSYGAVGSITCSNTTSYNTTSDYRLKENVSYDFDATTRLKQLKPARFNFIADADTTVDGFLAHEVQSIVPEAITGTKDATETKEKVVVNSDGNVIAENIEQADWETGKIADKDGNTQYPTDSTWEATKVVPVYQGIDQAKLVPLLVKTIQELEARITALENQP